MNGNINMLNQADCLTAMCVRVIAEYCGIRVPHDTMALIIARSRVEEELLENYSSAAESLDTMDRDWLLDLVGEYYTGKTHWPMYGDDPEYTATFRTALYTNARARGAEIIMERVTQ